MSVKNLVAVDWNSISLKFNAQKGEKISLEIQFCILFSVSS
jgi:hypothetical protein